MFKKLFLYSVLFLSVTYVSKAQNYNSYTEIGVMAGPVFLKPDFGERGDFENFYKNNGFSIGAFYYVSSVENYTRLREHFKLRLEISYFKCDLKHYGIYVAPEDTSVFAKQLRGMRGSTKSTNFGFQVEYYPFRTDDYNRGADFSPYISLGGQVSSVSTKIYSFLGPLSNPSVLPTKYKDAYKNESGQIIGSITSSIGTRYRLADYHSLIFDARLQYFFSDWVDGLNPDRSIYKENKYNDWSVTLNVGYVYYFN
jgi:hypothetical protein